MTCWKPACRHSQDKEPRLFCLQPHQTGGLLETYTQGDPGSTIGCEELFQEFNQRGWESGKTEFSGKWGEITLQQEPA